MKKAARLFSLILVLAAFAFMALGSDSEDFGDSTAPSPTAALHQPSESNTPSASAAPDSTSAPASEKPERNGFNDKTNAMIDFDQFSLKVPSYWKNGEKDGNSYFAYTFTIEENNLTKGAILSIGFAESDNATFANLKAAVESGELEKSLSGKFDDPTGLHHESYKNGCIAGFLYTWDCIYESLPGRARCMVAPVSNNSGFIIAYCLEINTDYSYYSDFNKILGSITDATNESAPSPTPTADDSVSYSTNGKSTVKNGNSGVYSYILSGPNYDIYYIIDFENGYVYYFTSIDVTADRVKIVSGDLNSVLVITYYDDGVTWSNGLHFKWKNQPDHLILEDDDGFEYDLYTTNLSKALERLKTKKIHDYSPP